MADAYLWNGNSGSSWGSAANWIDETTGADPATAVPGSGDPVTIAGLTGSIYEVISGGGSSASLGLTGYVDLSGRYGTGGLTVGAVSGAPNTASFTAGGLALAAGSGISAATVNVIDGSIALSGTGASVTASGAVRVGSPYGDSVPIAGQSYSFSGGASGSITLGAGATLSAASLTVADGSLSASGSGTSLTLSGTLSLGIAGSTSFVNGMPYYDSTEGSLSIASGASVSVAGEITTNYSYYYTSISVSGTGSSLTAGGTLTLDNELNAESGGTVRLGGLLLSSAYAEVYVDSASSVEIGSARNAATGAITVEAGNTVAATGSADLSGDIVDSGTISETGGGTLTLDGALSGSGQVQIGANSTLDMNGVAGAGDTIAFTGSAATMTIGSASTYNFSTNSYTYTPYAVSATLSGFATGDGIIVPNSEVETTSGTVVSSSALTNAVYTYAGNNTDSRPVFRQLRGRKPHPRRQLHRPHLLHQPDHQRRKRRHLAGPARPTVPSNEAVLVGVTTPLTGFSVTDPNAQATGITVTPTGTNGQLSATNAAGGTVTGSGTNDLVISGSLAQANGDLAPLTYLSNAGERHDQPECGRFDGQHRIAGKRPGYRYTGGPSGDHGNGVLAANTAAPGGGMIA